MGAGTILLIAVAVLIMVIMVIMFRVADAGTVRRVPLRSRVAVWTPAVSRRSSAPSPKTSTGAPRRATPLTAGDTVAGDRTSGNAVRRTVA